MASLSKIVKETGPVDLRVDYIGEESDIPKKGGGSWRGCKVILKSGVTSETYEHNVFKSKANMYKVGDLVRVDLNDQGYIDLTKVTSGDQRNNYEEVKKERAMAPVNAKLDQSYNERDISIPLQAFAKSWIESGVAKTPADACRLAKETYIIHQMDVLFLANPKMSDEVPQFQ